jgi:predicted small lipoprotein YifL
MTNTTIRNTLALLLSATLAACGEEGPPDTYSIDAAVPEWQQEAIRAAVGEWCDTAGLCPDEVPPGTAGGQRNGLIRVLGDYHERPGTENSAAVNWPNANDIWISPEASADAFKLYVSTLHEVFHWCSNDHLEDSPLMTERGITQEERYFGQIDQVAVDYLKLACAPFLRQSLNVEQ